MASITHQFYRVRSSSLWGHALSYSEPVSSGRCWCRWRHRYHRVCPGSHRHRSRCSCLGPSYRWGSPRRVGTCCWPRRCHRSRLRLVRIPGNIYTCRAWFRPCRSCPSAPDRRCDHRVRNQKGYLPVPWRDKGIPRNTKRTLFPSFCRSRRNTHNFFPLPKIWNLRSRISQLPNVSSTFLLNPSEMADEQNGGFLVSGESSTAQCLCQR